MWPFKPKPFLDDDAAQWHVDNVCWLIRHLYHTPMFQQTKLVLPAPGYFRTEAKGHELAVDILEQIKAFSGMGDWPVDLVSDTEVYEYNTRELIQIPHQNTPLGTFMQDHGNGVQISYAPALLNKPANLIATLAHEMSHYLIHSIPDTLPCAPEEEEFLTDQTACFLGFGVFMANSAFEFEQWRDDGVGTQGWRYQRSGYLPERDLIFNLALFLTFKAADAEQAKIYLKPHLADQLKAAMKDMDRWQPQLQAAKDNAYAA